MITVDEHVYKALCELRDRDYNTATNKVSFNRILKTILQNELEKIQP